MNQKIYEQWRKDAYEMENTVTQVCQKPWNCKHEKFQFSKWEFQPLQLGTVDQFLD